MIFFKIAIIILFTIPLKADVIRITNGEWQPYLSQYVYENGFVSHIIKESFKTEGIKIKWGFYTWNRSINLAKEGKKWDATAAWVKTNERLQDFYFSLPITESYRVFFHLRSLDFQWNKFEDILNYKMGLTRGYHYGKSLSKLIKEQRITPQIANSDEANFKKLLAGRIQIFPLNPIAGKEQLKDIFSNEERKKITFHPKRFSEEKLFLLISKKSSKGQYFLHKFNSGFQKLQKSGKIKEIYEKLEKGIYKKRKTIWN